MNVWAVIPMKALPCAKTRLAPVLTGAARAALAEAMLRQVLRVVVPQRGLCGALVVSRDPQVLALAREMGAVALHEPTEGDLNAALQWGASALSQRGATHALILPADLPFITARDLAALLEPPAMSVVIAPDAERTGTNALRLPLPFPFSPQYGEHSYQRHVQSTQGCGLSVHIVESATLALDVDTPADLAQYNQRVAQGLAPAGLAPFFPMSSHA